MFCSSCKRIDIIRECQRKICPVGHILCENCDENLKICPEPNCLLKISSYACVQIKNDVPRLYIKHFEESFNEESASTTRDEVETLKDHLLHGADSYPQIIFDNKHEDDIIPRRVLSYFELVDRKPTSAFFIDDEHEVMNMLSTETKEISKNNPEEKKKQNQAQLKMPHALKNDRQIQTSETYVVDKGAGDSMNFSKYHSPSFVNGPFSKCCNPHYNHYPNEKMDNDDQSTVSSCVAASMLHIYVNNKPVDESETAHFTSLSVSKTGLTPPDSPSMKGIPSLGHRVKFSTFYQVDRCIPAQMEPISLYEADSSESLDSIDELPSDRSRRLPRFPVQCPITNCESWSVPSDFCNHITIDHPYVEVLKIPPENLINMKINYKGNANMVMCQRLFLVSDKITDIGYGAFENCLPVTLLTSKMSLSKTFGFSASDDTLVEIFYIFLVGVYQFPINYTITLWAHGRDDFEPTMIKCMSNTVFFMNKPFNPKEVAGNSLGISYFELQKLTNDGSKMLSCQIMFH